jgi:integrase/recombinase XerC
VNAALLSLEPMGLSPDDLTAAPRNRAAVPTFAEYVPVVSAAVTDGTRKAYGSYWNRVVERWDARRLDEPMPSGDPATGGVRQGTRGAPAQRPR